MTKKKQTFIKPASWWRGNKEFEDRVLQAMWEGIPLARFLAQNYPGLKESTINKYFNNTPGLRERYKESKNRHYLWLEWRNIREEAIEEAKETGADVQEMFRTAKVDCPFEEYRVGEKGDPRWGAVMAERKREKKNKAALSQEAAVLS